MSGWKCAAKAKGSPSSAASAALKPLERRGLLRVEPDEKDRRSRRLRLTDVGHAALLAALPIWRQTHADIEMERPGVDIDELRASLRALA